MQRQWTTGAPCTCRCAEWRYWSGLCAPVLTRRATMWGPCLPDVVKVVVHEVLLHIQGDFHRLQTWTTVGALLKDAARGGHWAARTLTYGMRVTVSVLLIRKRDRT
jgi:hypothetical protein